MSRRMMRYVIPEGDTEISITIMGSNNPVLSGSPDGPIYLFFEENDELAPEHATFKLYETGEAVSGAYIGTVTDGKTAKHLYWSDYFDGFEGASERRYAGSTNYLPEVSSARSADNS